MNRNFCYQRSASRAGQVKGVNGMTRVLVRCGMVTAMAAASLGLGSGPVLAHNDWALPLFGGLAGGYALSSIHSRQEQQQRELQGLVNQQPTYYAAPQRTYAPPPPPPPAPAVQSATSIEDKLNVLDQLAAKGYITKSEYEARRQALLNQL